MKILKEMSLVVVSWSLTNDMVFAIRIIMVQEKVPLLHGNPFLFQYSWSLIKGC